MKIIKDHEAHVKVESKSRFSLLISQFSGSDDSEEDAAQPVVSGDVSGTCFSSAAAAEHSF